MKTDQLLPTVQAGAWPDDLLSFANANDPASTAERLRRTFMIYSESADKASALSFAKEWSPESVRADHALLRDLLDSLARDGPTDSVRAQIFRWTKSPDLNLLTMPEIGGMVLPPTRLLGIIKPNDIPQWYGLAVNEIVAQGFKVGRCPLRSCRDYFVFRPSRGRPRIYCFDPADHAGQDRAAASSHKMSAKKWRNRK
jgi:hypothetical protein